MQRSSRTICKTWRDYGECRINNCNLLYQNLCRKFFSLGFCDRYNCSYTHTCKRWRRDSVSPSTGSTQRNNWNRQGYQNNYQNYYTYGQGSHLNEEDINIYPNDRNSYNYRSNRGGPGNRRNIHQDHEQRTQRGNSRQDHFLGNQHPRPDLGVMVTHLLSAVERMNTTMERLERGEMNRLRR